MMKKILCAGLMVTDIVACPVDGLDLNRDSLVIDSVTIHNGGDGMNNAVFLAKLGAPVCFAGRAGRDEQGRFLAGVLRDLGVETHITFSDNKPTASSIVLVKSDGERTFIYSAGANTEFCAADIPDELLSRIGHLQIGGALKLPALDGEETAALFRRAHSLGVTTSLDVTFDPTGRWFETLKPILPVTDFFLPSIGEARVISGRETPEECAVFFLDNGVGAVAIKLGEKGCLLQTRMESLSVPAFPVNPVVDTTGAGDAFCGGFLYGVANGWPLARCAEVGNAVAALNVTKIGATEGAPTWDEVNRLLQRR